MSDNFEQFEQKESSLSTRKSPEKGLTEKPDVTAQRERLKARLALIENEYGVKIEFSSEQTKYNVKAEFGTQLLLAENAFCDQLEIAINRINTVQNGFKKFGIKTIKVNTLIDKDGDLALDERVPLNVSDTLEINYYSSKSLNLYQYIYPRLQEIFGDIFRDFSDPASLYGNYEDEPYFYFQALFENVNHRFDPVKFAKVRERYYKWLSGSL